MVLDQRMVMLYRLANVLTSEVFIGYFIHLHFKCYPPSQFSFSKPPISSPFPFLL